MARAVTLAATRALTRALSRGGAGPAGLATNALLWDGGSLAWNGQPLTWGT